MWIEAIGVASRATIGAVIGVASSVVADSMFVGSSVPVVAGNAMAGCAMEAVSKRTESIQPQT